MQKNKFVEFIREHERKKKNKGRLQKGYRRGYARVEDEGHMNCNWLQCAAGMGLAGCGRCFLNGFWWHRNCSLFISDEEWWKQHELDCKMEEDNNNNSKKEGEEDKLWN